VNQRATAYCGPVRRRWIGFLIVVGAATVGCASGGDDTGAAAATTTTPPTTVARATTVAPSTTATRAPSATSTTRRTTAATAIIEPDTVAGIGLGATKAQAIAVLGPPTRTSQETDLSGKKYAMAKVTAAYGALQAFCCDTKVASVNQGPGRMIVIVGNASGKVDQIVGGDPALWSRKIAD
jgi:hypothetical protein